MTEKSNSVSLDSRQLAKKFFNETWTYLEKPDRSPEEDLLMIHLAHASRLHWHFAGLARNWAIGEWQISRVYAVLGRAEPALFHANSCMQISYDNHLLPFHLGCAHEAMARALAISGDAKSARHHLAKASELAQSVSDAEDKRILESDLATIPLDLSA